MEQAFEIAALLNIKGNAEQKLLQFTTQLRKTHAMLDNFLLSMSKLGISFRGFDETLGLSNPKLTSMSSRLNTLSRNADRSAASFERLSVSMERTAIGGGSGRAVGGASRGHGWGGFAGKIGAGAGMALGGIGFASAFGGYELFKSSYNAASGFQQAQMQLSAQGGLSQTQLNSATQFARNNLMKGVSSTEMLHSISDVYMATKDFNTAMQLAPTIAGMTFGNQTIFGKGFGRLDMRSLLQTAEIMSGGNLQKFDAILGVSEKLFSAYGGRLKPQEILNFLRRGQIATYGLSTRGIYGLELAMQEMSGRIVGTGLRTGYGELMGGQMNRSQAADLLSLGLIDRSKIQYNKLGGIRKVLPGALDAQYRNMLTQDPFGFLQMYLGVLKQHGITDSKDIYQHIALDFSRTFANLLATLYKNESKIERAIPSNMQAYGPHTVYQQSLNMQKGAEGTFIASWGSFTTALGQYSSPIITKSLIVLSETLDVLTKFLNGPFKTFLKVIPTLHLPAALMNYASSIPGGGAAISVIKGIADHITTIHAHTHVNIGHKELVTYVNTYNVKQMSRPQSGTNYVNPQQGLLPVAYSGTGI